MDDCQNDDLRLGFDHCLKLKFLGSKGAHAAIIGVIAILDRFQVHPNGKFRLK